MFLSPFLIDASTSNVGQIIMSPKKAYIPMFISVEQAENMVSDLQSAIRKAKGLRRGTLKRKKQYNEKPKM